MPFIAAKCPWCGKSVDIIEMPGGESYGYYDKPVVTPSNKRLGKCLGLPCETHPTHICKGIKQIIKVRR